MAGGYLFNNIALGGRSGPSPGQLRVVDTGGIVWKKQGGGKAVEVDKTGILGLSWMKVPRTNQLGVISKEGFNYKFTGFLDQTACGITPDEKQLSVSGKNWGEVDLNGNTLGFLVGSKQAFEVSLADVSQTQLRGTNDINFEGLMMSCWNFMLTILMGLIRFILVQYF